MPKPTIFRQCTLYRRDNFGTVKKLVEWVPAPLAVIDGKVTWPMKAKSKPGVMT